jgi:signal transduction histidine kinase
VADLGSASLTGPTDLTTLRPAVSSDPGRVERPAAVASLPDDALEEINRLWTVVRAFSSTAHDVNNAMQVIAGNAELLEARDLDPLIRRRVELIRTEAARVSTTINRLLQYSSERGAAVQRLDLWPFAESAVAMRASSAGRHRVVLAIERSHPEPMFAVCESSKILQAMLDLLLAAEAFLAGRRNARVTLTLERRGEFVAVKLVADGERDETTVDDSAAASRSSLTVGLQLWSAAHLAASQHGHLEVVDDAHVRTYALALPAAKP